MSVSKAWGNRGMRVGCCPLLRCPGGDDVPRAWDGEGHPCLPLYHHAKQNTVKGHLDKWDEAL